VKKARRRAAQIERDRRRTPQSTPAAPAANPALRAPPENRDSCDMRERPEDFDFHGPEARPGDFAIVSTAAPNKQVYFLMWHILPDGSVGAVPLDPVPEAAKPTWTHGTPPQLHTWKWDGNRTKPTLHPSVWRRGHWHGWFRAGRMVSV
jgi:hypothetical protein